MNNALEEMNNEVTMNSLEIAELTGKRHVHVICDIYNLIKELKLVQGDFVCCYKASNSKILRMFRLPLSLVESLLMCYPDELRQAVIDKLEELGKTISLEDMIKECESIVEPCSKCTDDEDYLTLDGAADKLGQDPQEFIMFLREEGMLIKFRQSGNLLPLQDSINKGWMKVHTDDFYHLKTGEKISKSSTRITSKGLIEITERLNNRNIDVCTVINRAYRF